MVPHDDDELIYLSQNEFVQLNNDLGKVQCLKKQTEKKPSVWREIGVLWAKTTFLKSALMLSLTLYSPRGGEFSPPLEKTCFSKADFSYLLKETLETESISDWPQIFVIY